MKIAIDARKWRDYGIGTYVRNVVRHLALLEDQLGAVFGAPNAPGRDWR